MLNKQLFLLSSAANLAVLVRIGNLAGKVFFYLIYFEIRYLTAIIFDETRITIRATNTKNTDPF
jgi:hypothetical protein